jgi:hypothetical protein
MSGGLLLAAAVAAAQEHSPPAAHMLVLAGVAAVALVAFGLIRWRRARTRPEREPDSPAADSGRSEEPR